MKSKLSKIKHKSLYILLIITVITKVLLEIYPDSFLKIIYLNKTENYIIENYQNEIVKLEDIQNLYDKVKNKDLAILISTVKTKNALGNNREEIVFKHYDNKDTERLIVSTDKIVHNNIDEEILLKFINYNNKLKLGVEDKLISNKNAYYAYGVDKNKHNNIGNINEKDTLEFIPIFLEFKSSLILEAGTEKIIGVAFEEI